MRWWDQMDIDWDKAFGDIHVGGGDVGHRKQGKRLKWGGMERSECR